MKRSLIASALLGLGLLAMTGVACAQAPNLGRTEYESNCVSCHGPLGKGDGPFAKVMTVKTPDLSTIAKRNGGVFPIERIQQIIDGREVPPGHGARRMPVWGLDYMLRAQEKYRDFPGFDEETYIRVRILALIDYLHTLQVR